MLKNTNILRGLLALILLTSTVPLVWAQAEEELDSMFDDRPCCRVIPPRRVLTQVLELDDAQLEQVAALAQEIAATVGPLREELRMLIDDLKAELGSADPDPCLVGDLVIAIRNLKIEICRTVHSFEGDFNAILTPEQLEKWLEIKPHFCKRRKHRGGNDGGEDRG